MLRFSPVVYILTASPEIRLGRRMVRLHKWQTRKKKQTWVFSAGLTRRRWWWWVINNPICPHPPRSVKFIAAQQDKSNRKQIRTSLSPPIFCLPLFLHVPSVSHHQSHTSQRPLSTDRDEFPPSYSSSSPSSSLILLPLPLTFSFAEDQHV